MRLALFLFAMACAAQPPLPRVIRFSAEPASINLGQSVTLTWQVENADAVAIAPAVGSVALAGTATVTPPASTVYVLTARNASGTAQSTVQVVVLISAVVFHFNKQLMNFFDVGAAGSATQEVEITPSALTTIELRIMTSDASGVWTLRGSSSVRTALPFTVAIAFTPPGPGNYSAILQARNETYVDQANLRGAASSPESIRVRWAGNGASFPEPVSANTWISILGERLSVATREWTSSDFVEGKLPVKLGDSSVTIGGRAAYVSFVSPSQINALVPGALTEGLVEGVVESAGRVSNRFTLDMRQRSPEFFQIGVTNYAAATLPDASVVGPRGMVPNSRPARRGEVVALWMTGLGATIPTYPDGWLPDQSLQLDRPPEIRVGSTRAEVIYAYLVGPGLYQVGIRVPEVPDGDWPLRLDVAGSSSTRAPMLAVSGTTP